MSISKWIQEEGAASAEDLLQTLIKNNNDRVRIIESEYRNLPEMKEVKRREINEDKKKIKHVTSFLNEKDMQKGKPLTEVYKLTSESEYLSKEQLQDLLYKLSDKVAEYVSFQNEATGSNINVVGGSISYDFNNEGVIEIGEHTTISTDDLEEIYAFLNGFMVVVGILDRYSNKFEIGILTE
ncbi:hypothetical protein JF544_18780 [Halobacillus kuroshimensis]|uniref:Uncharacterized protein n=1 Tax=Halobacillus kuroshimensis TaxID=302481 RepID=A0ABS3E1C9_9BACI|nr:hypothetical protein [Halobacillus kuroshimensis]MBN8237293.1 hypothetical protein [Halobacillus kuroshimensis]